MRKLVSISVLLLLSAPAFAAEVSLLAGYRSGGPSVEVPVYYCIAAPCIQPMIEAEGGEAYGLIVDLPFRDQLMFEILISHQSGEFEDDFIEGERLADLGIYIYPPEFYPPSRPNRFDLTYLHLGLLRQWQNTRVSPFAAVGIGIAQLEVTRFYYDSIDDDRLSASLAGGLKVSLNKWLGVRVEGRGYWADMPESVGEDLFQLELSSGLIFKI